MNSPNEVKARAYKLRDVLSVMGHQLKHSESLEVISQIEGYPDWNTYTADIARKRQTVGSSQDNNEPDRIDTPSDHSIIDAIERTYTPSDHPIIDAIKLDNKAMVKALLSDEILSNKSLISEAFYQTVVLERISIAELLITQGADVGSVVIRGLSLCEFAVYTERYDYAKVLFSKFRHLKGIHGKDSKILPLVISLHDKDEDILDAVKILLDQGANINAQNRQGDTAIILAGYNREDLELVTYLVERGADVNICNENGDTPLMDAAEKRNIKILKYLLSVGADINIKNNIGLTALDKAKDRNDSEAISLLTSHKGH